MKKIMLMLILGLQCTFVYGAGFTLHGDKANKPTLVDGDIFGIEDSEDSYNIKNATMANMETYIKTNLGLGTASVLDAGLTIGDVIVVVDVGYCSDTQYTDQATCEANTETWTAVAGVNLTAVNLPTAAGYQVAGVALTASAIGGATATQGSNADTAFGWGDHSLAGYLSQTTGDARYSLTTHNHTGVYQPISTNLTSFATVTPSANGLSLVSAADYAAMRGLLNVEAALGNPASDGYVLSSTAAGVRSWVAQSGGAAENEAFEYVYYDVTATDTGYKHRIPTGSSLQWSTAYSWCDGAESALVYTVYRATSLGGTFSSVGTIAHDAAAETDTVDLTAWTDPSAGDWLRVDITTAGTSASECTLVIELTK